MAKVKLNIRGLSTTEKVAKARQIITALTDKAAFTTPQPPLAAITTAADELEAAHAETQTARQTAVTKTNIMHEREDAIEALLRQLAGYIESVAGDDESKILSAGISIRTTTPATQAPATPIAPGVLHYLPQLASGSSRRAAAPSASRERYTGKAVGLETEPR